MYEIGGRTGETGRANPASGTSRADSKIPIILGCINKMNAAICNELQVAAFILINCYQPRM